MSALPPEPTLNRYGQIIERIFFAHYRDGMTEVRFERQELVDAATALGIALPKNLGDLVYSFRYRVALPASVQARAPTGQGWIIRPTGRSRYAFVASALSSIVPTTGLVETKIPDATPGIISMYALTDEQALLAKLRYNRLVDVFTGLTCYSLQSHLRTAVQGIGQVESDEIYVGLDRRGSHHVIPVQAKGGRDRLGVVQIEQDVAMCAAKFPALICRPIASQFMARDLIVMFAFEMTDSGVAISGEKHYRLVSPDQLSAEELALYRTRTD